MGSERLEPERLWGLATFSDQHPLHHLVHGAWPQILLARRFNAVADAQQRRRARADAHVEPRQHVHVFKQPIETRRDRFVLGRFADRELGHLRAGTRRGVNRLAFQQGQRLHVQVQRVRLGL